MIEKCEPLTNIFDIIHHFWEHPRTQRGFAAAILVVYLAGLIGIEANRQGLLPPWLAHITPMSHFRRSTSPLRSFSAWRSWSSS